MRLFQLVLIMSACRCFNSFFISLYTTHIVFLMFYTSLKTQSSSSFHFVDILHYYNTRNSSRLHVLDCLHYYNTRIVPGIQFCTLQPRYIPGFNPPAGIQFCTLQPRYIPGFNPPAGWVFFLPSFSLCINSFMVVAVIFSSTVTLYRHPGVTLWPRVL